MDFSDDQSELKVRSIRKTQHVFRLDFRVQRSAFKMPRGIPNVKRDERAFRYTTFNVPLVANPKHMNTTYLKSETQTLWARNAKGKTSEESPPQDQRTDTEQMLLYCTLVRAFCASGEPLM